MMMRIGPRSALTERRDRRKRSHPAKGAPVGATRSDLDRVSKRLDALEKKPETPNASE